MIGGLLSKLGLGGKNEEMVISEKVFNLIVANSYPSFHIDNPQVDEKCIQLCRDSWKAVSEGDTDPYRLAKAADPSLEPKAFFFNTFYDRLFEVNPDVQHLFKSSRDKQGRALFMMINVSVGILDKGDKLVPALQQLAVRHNKYAIKSNHYELVGRNLMCALKSVLGDHKFTDEVRLAWATVYSLMMVVMLPIVIKDQLESQAVKIALNH